MNFGSNLAVVAAGFITDDQGWRWVWWWCAIFFGLQLIAFVFGFEETKYQPLETFIGRRSSIASTSGIPQEVGSDSKDEKNGVGGGVSPDIEGGSEDNMASDHEYRKMSAIQLNPNIPRKPYRQRLSLLTTTPGDWSHFLRHSWQPFMILGSIPGVLFCSLVYAVLLAWSTVQTTALSTYMLDPPYNFSASSIGLMSLAPFVGNTLGLIICGPVSDWLVLRLSKRNNGIYEPEMRFWVFVPFIP